MTGWPAHQAELVFGQCGRLVQHGLGNADLADVVQLGGEAEELALPGGQPEGLGQPERIAAHAQRMAGRVSVAFLHRADEAVDGGKEGLADAVGLTADGAFEVGAVRLVLLLQAVGARGGVEDVAELVELDRLEEVVMGAGLPALVGGSGVAAGRQYDDADLWPAAADLAHQPDAAAPGMRRSVTTIGVRCFSSNSSACSAVLAAWQR